MELDVTIIDFGAMSEAITQYKQTVDTIAGIIEAVQAVQAALQVGNIFTGGAATAVLEAIKTYINVMNTALDNLNQLIEALTNKLETYEAAHNDAVNIAGSIEQAVWAEV
jgi:uncharacterized protein YukE